MATFQSRGGKWRAIVRRKGFPSRTRTFPTKTAAKTWADRIERELAEREATGTTVDDDATIGDLIDWRTRELGSAKAISKTQAGNMTRLREGLGSVVARKLAANDVIEHARRRVGGKHMRFDGVIIPACAPATMNVELGFLSEVLKLAGPMRG